MTQNSEKWINQYVELEFKDFGRDRSGLDCWGLVRLIYSEQFNIFLPSFCTGYETPKDRTLLGEKERTNLPLFWVKVEVPVLGNVALFRVLRDPVHIGMMIDAHRMIHITRGINSCIERIDSSRWSKRLVGIYEHISRKR